MRRTAFFPIAGFGLALGLVLGATGAMAQQNGGDYGRDLAGEACHGTSQPDGGTAILCGASTTPSGMLHFIALRAPLPANEPLRRNALIAAARQSPGAALNGPDAVRCGDAKILDADAVLFVCTLGVTSWPHVILVSASQRGIALAEGLPGMMPVLVAAAGGKQTGTQADAALAAVKAAFPARVLEASAADYAGYLQRNNQGHSAANAGNFAAAETAYRDALDIETRLFGPDSAAVGATLLELALQVSNQQRSDEAAALFRRAAPIIERAASPTMRTREASYRALDAANQRNYGDARKYAHDAVTARQADVDAVRRSGTDLNGNAPVVPIMLEGELAHDLRLEAEMAMRLGDLPGAQAAAEQALYIVTEQPDLPLSWRPEMVALMGEINARQGRVVIAERDFTDALAMDKRLYGEGPPTIAAQLQLARFYADEQVYPSAIATYRDAFAGLAKDPVARSQLVPDQIVPFLASAAATTGTADRATLDSEAFAASQFSDSGVAAQTIARVAARRAADTPALALDIRADEDAARARDELRLALAAERAKSDDERDAVREKSLTAELPGAIAAADAAAAKTRREFPAYAELADPGAVTLATLQKTLRPHEAFVSFVIGQRAGYVLLVTPNALTVRPVAATVSSLAADITDLRSAFVPQLGGLPEFSLAASAALYRQLLGPVASQMAGIDHLAVAANGDLASLPFSLLVTRDSQPRDYAHAAWLIRQTAVSQIPSARAFIALRNATVAAAPRPFLGLGNPQFRGAAETVGTGAGNSRALNALATTCQQSAAADPDLLRALPPLPDTATEVRTIGTDLKAPPDDILLGAGASETALRAKPLDQYAVLYFATHGLLPGELHCQAQPGLVLSPPATPGPANADGLLTASEIANLRLNARLVVLSACNTAAAGGSRFGGGALEGLADAFFDAGAHAVLASHWEVPSAATTSLMTGLFANLVRDPAHDTAEALRQAQLSLIAQPGTAHPFDWAAFTLIGDGA